MKFKPITILIFLNITLIILSGLVLFPNTSQNLKTTSIGSNISTANMTATGTATVSGTTTLNGTLNANSQVNLGDNGDTVAINSSDWDISATGVMTGLGAITSDGDITTTGAYNLSAAGSVLTIASGVITVTKSYHVADTEGTAASDDLDTINGGTEGDIVVIRPNADTRTIVAKNATGNLKLEGNFTMEMPRIP